MGAKYLGHYGGYESFWGKLLEYHENNNIKYYVVYKANGDGMMFKMDFKEVVKLDTQYIGEWSVKGDIKIIWQTAVGALRNDGAM